MMKAYSYDPNKSRVVNEQREAQESKAERVNTRAQAYAVKFGADLGKATKAALAVEDGMSEDKALLEFGLAGAKARR